MNINHLNFFKILSLLLLLAIMHCSTTPIAGSETTNGLTVAVVNNAFKGTSVPSSRVFCYSSTYNPNSGTGFSDTATTDSHGTFTFSDCPLSAYTIYAYSQNDDSAAIIQNISNVTNKPDTNTAFQSVVSIEGTTMQPGGIIVYARVYIPGTPFVTTSDSCGKFGLQKLPKGTFEIHSYANVNWTKGLISDSITINLSDNNYRAVTVTLNLK